jgi:hypothetical protein
MPEFVNIPPLDIADSNEQWILTEACIYQSDLPKRDPELVVVPEGTRTDLSSIPRLFRFVIIKNGKHRAAAIVHDWLCKIADTRRDRRLADKIFLEAMKLLKVRRLRRFLMYLAVASMTTIKRFPK